MPNYPLLLRPVSKEIIWGGTRLKNDYGKTAPFDKIAESWELTVRPDEKSIITIPSNSASIEYCLLWYN